MAKGRKPSPKVTWTREDLRAHLVGKMEEAVAALDALTGDVTAEKLQEDVIRIVGQAYTVPYNALKEKGPVSIDLSTFNEAAPTDEAEDTETVDEEDAVLA